MGTKEEKKLLELDRLREEYCSRKREEEDIYEENWLKLIDSLK